MKIIGPIEVTSKSHPFSSMKFSRKVINVEDYGFVEEEYFIKGLADIYDYDENLNVHVYDSNLNYCTRILVRRPISKEKFTGICYVDIMNASNGYDIEDLWRCSYLHVMENNHMYVGVTTKPINVLSLKNFDFDRYKELDWSSKQPAPQPTTVNPKTASILGTEEGLVWDILYQVGKEIKNNPSGFCGDLKPEYVYLSGQSQSGMYLNTYINFMHNYYKEKGYEKVYDGYLVLASGGLSRELRQKENAAVFSVIKVKESNVDVPTISFNTENDYELFEGFGGLTVGVNEDSETNKRRYYDMAGSAHTDAASPLVPTNEEIVKTKCPPRILDGEYNYRLNDLPFDYYINGMLEKLHIWAKDKIAPKIVEPILLDESNNMVRDEHGNVLKGFRSPFMDVPKASYKGSYSKGATNGTMTFFTKDKMDELYGSLENYLAKFEENLNKQVEEGFVSVNDAKRAMAWAKNINK